jgi:gamma-glutamyltranspeptidase / glutathione hydrolase
LTSLDYAAGLRAGIHPDKATPSDMLPGYLETSQGVHTSHFSIIDKEGNLVSGTQTVNLIFGSAFVVPGTGFVLNDEMDDFALKAGAANAFGLVGGDANAPKPGHRMLSSMTPTFLSNGDKVGVIGTPGGSRIITMVLEGVLAFIDGELPETIVANKRFHHQYLPDIVEAEAGAFTREETKALQAMGYVVNENPHPWGFMNVVSWDRKTGEMHAGSDPRGASGSGLVK